jgi:L-threonylcarbamoyladenylate synthase
LTEVLAADPTSIARAAALLVAGELVAFGTETVYGLGADATNGLAVADVFAAKGRPQFNPLICHYPDADAAFNHVQANEAAKRLAEAFWPGPLTLVLPRRVPCPVTLLAGAGLETLAVRVPAGPVALALLRDAARPVAAPSANRSGQVSPTTAAHVLADLGGRIAAIIDCGPCRIGVESTVVDLTGERPSLLRPGGSTREAIEALIGPIGIGAAPSQVDASLAPRSPGQLTSHYAPVLAVRLNALDIGAHEALLAFGPPPAHASLIYQLSATGDLAEAAANLFAGLRLLDAEGLRRGHSRIAVMPIPMIGLGLAIHDRLQRAAAPRGP